MNRPTKEPFEDCRFVSDVVLDHVDLLNEYINWLEGKGLHHDRVQLDHDTQHVRAVQEGSIPDRIEGSTVREGGTDTPHPPGGEEEGVE